MSMDGGGQGRGPRELLTVPDVATRLRVSVDTVYTLARECAGFPVIRIGRRMLRFRADLIDDWAAQQAARSMDLAEPDALRPIQRGRRE